MNGDTLGKRARRSVILLVSVSLLICVFLAGPVSASGSSSGGSGGSSEVTYSSTTLFTNWALVQGDYYDAVIKNPSSCVSRVTVVLPKKPSSVTVDYLSYAIGKYSDQLTAEQKRSLMYSMDNLPPADMEALKHFEDEYYKSLYGTSSGNAPYIPEVGREDR